ncbi:MULTISPECIES: type IV pilus secretin PilQ [Proteus]|uniref:Type IV pilus biogenesis and competence protein PilQ n=1 Tax=Proteus penneri TaxID=102862 RepID=A0A0G4QHC4_9GAMM|nr:MULTISPECIES: type IV pilus secretin PilQ [Proteus]EEG86271.1 type IV pilus secretin PilQ [Proteus penneri ATCC 35198]MBJ2118236.1 type IV pilus secretin PilQ [Proteus penneri]MCO8050939.1 type IV pilus secretin PilQ [Proteus penneri]MCX2587942.1 type IV pilus secretin PilQ [Proteus penneri]NBL77475.1 type IV pilus secretin PilQ [Proteus sp. G2672]
MKIGILIAILSMTTTIWAHTRDPFFPQNINNEKISSTFIEERTSATEQSEELHHQLYPLNYADAERLGEQLTNHTIPLLSQQGRVIIDREANSLSIIDNSKTLSEIEDWLKLRDTPQQQVHITAHIVSSSQDALNELGTQWGLQALKTQTEATSTTVSNTISATSSLNSALSTPSLSALSLHQNTKNPLHYIAFNIARINGRLLELELSALEQEKQLSIIASPRLTTAHEKTASIKQGTEIPYVSRDNEITQVQFKEAVLGMEVTPIIQRNKKIRLILKISQNTPGIALVQSGSEHLSIDKQEISTEVAIRDGETIMLGGIFQQKQQEHTAKIPFLSSIPLLGVLFSHKRDQHSRHELVIFITPKLI